MRRCLVRSMRGLVTQSIVLTAARAFTSKVEKRIADVSQVYYVSISRVYASMMSGLLNEYCQRNAMQPLLPCLLL
jgi:hypothetical protein